MNRNRDVPGENLVAVSLARAPIRLPRTDLKRTETNRAVNGAVVETVHIL
jgi:hypothetical protein